MVALVKSKGLDIAEIVYLHMSKMTDYSDHENGPIKPETTIFVDGFTSHSVTGYHFSGIMGARQCNVTEDRRCAGIVFNYGRRDDYDYETGQAKDGATRIDFEVSEAYDVAKLAMDWLVLGIEPRRNSRR